MQHIDDENEEVYFEINDFCINSELRSHRENFQKFIQFERVEAYILN